MAITDDVKLSIYNGALLRLGSRKLASLTEGREPRRVLDDVWGTADNVVGLALEAGEWNFAIRTVQATYSAEIEPAFGFRRAFKKPDDFRRMASIASEPRFQLPLTHEQYVDEAGYWFSDFDDMFIRFVSDDSDYGYNSGGWSEGFKNYLQCYMAWESCERITNSTRKEERLEKKMMQYLARAKSLDAMDEGTKFRPPGSWIQSRWQSGRRERSRLS